MTTVGHRNLERERDDNARINFGTTNRFKQALLPGITSDFGVLQHPIMLVICTSAGSVIWGRRMESCLFWMQGHLALSFICTILYVFTGVTASAA